MQKTKFDFSPKEILYAADSLALTLSTPSADEKLDLDRVRKGIIYSACLRTRRNALHIPACAAAGEIVAEGHRIALENRPASQTELLGRVEGGRASIRIWAKHGPTWVQETFEFGFHKDEPRLILRSRPITFVKRRKR